MSNYIQIHIQIIYFYSKNYNNSSNYKQIIQYSIQTNQNHSNMNINMNIIHNLQHLQHLDLLYLLQQQIANSNQNLYVMCISKSKITNPTPQIIDTIRQLINIQGEKWLQCIRRLSINNYDLTFDCSINHIQCYKALLSQIHLAKQYQFVTLSQKIQNLLTYYGNLNVNFEYIWEVYFQYLQIWSRKFQNRLLKVLTQINQRLLNSHNVYENISAKNMPKFLNLISTIIYKLEKKSIKQLTLYNLLISIPKVNEFCYLKIEPVFQQFRNKADFYFLNNNKRNFQLFQEELKFFISSSKTACFYQFFFKNSDNFVTFFYKTPIIRNHHKQNYDDLISLQDSLIYCQYGDDLENYMGQLLNSLCLNVDNFLFALVNIYLVECKKLNNEISLEDMILKLCIICGHIQERYDLHQQICEIVNNILSYVQTRDKCIQNDLILMKVIKMMNLYNSILPNSNFQLYHTIGFNLLYSHLDNLVQNGINQRIPVQNYFLTFLQQQINFKQFSNKKSNSKNKDRFLRQLHQNCLWLCEQIIKIVSNHPGNNKLYQILFHLIRQFKTQIQKISETIFQFLIQQLSFNFTKMMSANKKTSPQILKLLECLYDIVQSIEQDKCMQFQDKLMPLLSVLQQPQNIDFQDQILKILPILMKKSQCITPNLAKILINTKNVFQKNNFSLNALKEVIQELCQQNFCRSIYNNGYQNLIQFFGSIICEYLHNLIDNSDYNQIFTTQWQNSVYLIQLIIQTYDEVVKNTAQKFKEIYFKVCYLPQSEQKFQLLLVFHHICPKTFQIPNQNFANYQIKLRYTVNLTQIMYVDNFLFKNSNQKLLNLQGLINFHNKTKQNNYQMFQKSNFDGLPFGKIRVGQYIQEGLRQLKKLGQLDDFQYQSITHNFRN